MPYATLDDLLVRYRPIRTMIGSRDLNVTSTEVVSVYISQAEAYVDAYLGNRFVTPFETQQPLITQSTADLAIFFMLAEKAPGIPEFMDARRQRADELLKQIAKGELALRGATMVGTAANNFAWSPTMGRTPVFSPVLGELDQVVDEQRVIDELMVRDLNRVPRRY